MYDTGTRVRINSMHSFKNWSAIYIRWGRETVIVIVKQGFIALAHRLLGKLQAKEGSTVNVGLGGN